ncbi:MAG: CapA family protein [Muribaculaceae bacterium]|nr:CapA family protein [Muribaculaceae bacterium]
MKLKIATLLSLAICLTSCAMKGESANSSQHNPTVLPDSIEIIEIPETPETENINKKPLSLAFTGDIMMGTTYPSGGNYIPANDGADLFSDVTEILSAVDIAAGNLEGTLLDVGGQAKKCSDPSICYAFKMPTKYVKNLVNAGYDFVGIANNHINDFGPEGLASTQKTLKENGILFAGLRASCPTAVTEIDGRKIGFAAFGHNRGTLSILDMNEVANTVKGLADECDFVVVSFHGGGEGPKFQHVPHKTETCFGENRGNVEAFAHAAIDAGADVVYGHGPHVNRAVELYKDHLIMYSLGNFCTPYRMGLGGVSGYAPVVTVNLNPDGTFESGKIHSFIQQKGKGPRKDATNSVAKNMRSLTKADFPNTRIEIADDGTITKK